MQHELLTLVSCSCVAAAAATAAESNPNLRHDKLHFNYRKYMDFVVQGIFSMQRTKTTTNYAIYAT